MKRFSRSALKTGPVIVATLLLLCSPGMAATDENKSININITTHLGDSQSFVAGDVISFLVSLDRDAFIYLYYQDASGRVLQILPNSKQQDHFYQQGLFQPLPPAQAEFQFRVGPPFGDEQLVLFASERRDIEIETVGAEAGFGRVKESLSDLQAQFKQPSSKLLGQARLAIKTRAR